MSSGLGTGSLPPSPSQVLGLLLSVDRNALQSIVLAVQANSNPPAGIALLTAQTPAQVQLLAGPRRTFSPFQY